VIASRFDNMEFAEAGRYSVASFDRHLKGDAAGLLDGTAGNCPEVLFETCRTSGTRGLS